MLRGVAHAIVAPGQSHSRRPTQPPGLWSPSSSEPRGEPARPDLLAILLARGEPTGAQCGERAGVSHGRVSAHLACLVSCGLAVVRRESWFALYQVAAPRVAEIVGRGTDPTADHVASIAACLVVGR